MPRKICFIHLPKTGGTTLSSYLDDWYDYDKICPAPDQHTLEKMAADLHRYDLFRGHFELYRIPAVVKDNAELVTILRHPVSRVISRFHHWRRDPELLASLMRSPLLHNHNIQTMALSPLSMDGYTTLREHLEAAKRTLDTLCFVGLQEQFVKSYEGLARLLGHPAPQIVRHHNASSYDRNSAPKALIEELTAANWADIELYEHGSILFRERFLPLATADAASAETISTSTVPPAAVHYRMEQRLLGSGWHEREGFGPDDVQRWRWTGPETESILYLPLAKSHSYRFSMRVLNAASAETMSNFKVAVNDNALTLSRKKAWAERFRKSAMPGVLFDGLVDANMTSSPESLTKVSIIVDKTIPQKESDPNSSNERLCGLAITEINFDPL